MYSSIDRSPTEQRKGDIKLPLRGRPWSSLNHDKQQDLRVVDYDIQLLYSTPKEIKVNSIAISRSQALTEKWFLFDSFLTTVFLFDSFIPSQEILQITNNLKTTNKNNELKPTT